MSAALKQDFLPIASKRNPKRLSFLCIPAYLLDISTSLKK